MSQVASEPRRRRPGLRRSVPGPNEVRFAQALGVVLRVLRQCRRLDAKKLAAVTGSGYIQLTRYEAGEALPTMSKLLELLTAMGVSFDTFAQMQSLANRMVGLGYPEVTLAERLAHGEEEQLAAAAADARSSEGATGTS